MSNIMLIVDTAYENRIHLRRIFEAQFEVVEATCGEEAFEILEEHREEVKVILLNLMLPKMSGFEFLQKRKEVEEYVNIPTVMISKMEETDNQIKGFNLGANEFIIEPFVDEIVKIRVNNVVGSFELISNMKNEYNTLRHKSVIDEMTGLLNKQSTEHTIDEILSNSEGELNVLMILDIDHFKTVNDTLGHQVGDRVIKIIGRTIANSLRKTDIVGRIGGDEFCVLMRNVPDMDIVHRKVRELLQIMKYKPNLAIPEYVSLSIGLVTNDMKNATYENLFKKADVALYNAKIAGRAQCREFGVEPGIMERELEVNDNQEEKKSADSTILIVDDDSINRAILRKILKGSYNVIEAENGIEALKLIRKYSEKIMAIVLDLFMPIMDGYQVLAEIRRNISWKNIPVIISTVDDSEESDLKTLNLGANLVVHKPLNPAITLKQIDNLVENYRERKSDIREYMLHKTLIGNKDNTFLCTYHVDEGKVEIGENYLRYMSEDFPQMFDTYPFTLDKFVLPTDYDRIVAFFDIKNSKKVHEEIEVRFRVDNIHYEWFEITKMVNYDDNKNIDNAIFMFLNIEYSMEAKKNLIFLATHDSLTHIHNMQTFCTRVVDLIGENSDKEFVLLTMDIFQFRVVNNIFGYEEGDKIIKYMAMKMQELIEGFEFGEYCRISSDIFAACISRDEDITGFIQAMQQAMYSYPLKFQMKLCFGLYKINGNEESVDIMIEHSSFARKRTKEAPIKTYLYYDEELRKKETFENVVISEVDQALREAQFEVYLQPKCDIEIGKIIGAEALIRWNHPDRGRMSPGDFIPILEKNGFCQELDCFVYEEVCRTLREWLDNNMEVVPVSVNVSRRNLYDEGLADQILDIVDKYKIPHDLIEFEITESAFVMETNLLTNFSEKMRSRGFHILLDDFGSGYSSLNSLKDISVDVIKIDIKFLPVTKKDEKANIVLSSVITMGKKLGLDVIAEGVETKEQVELLDELGCKWVQGYYFYRPMPAASFRNALDSNK